MTEDLGNVDKLVQKWLPEIKAWNVHAVLPAGFELADGVSVSPLKDLGYYDHGVDFRELGEVPYKMAAQSVKSEHDNANFIEVFPYKDGQVARYSLGIFFKDRFNRSEFGKSRIEFQFLRDLGDVLVEELRQNPDLIDRLILAKFPALATREIKPWKELIYLPPDLNSQNRDEKLQVLAIR